MKTRGSFRMDEPRFAKPLVAQKRDLIISGMRFFLRFPDAAME
jgi:hypothetical protein